VELHPLSLEHSPIRQRGALRPRFGRIRDAVAYSGISRSQIYLLAGRRPGLMRKSGTSTLIDFDVFDQVLDELAKPSTMA